jgi:hypothetical protein
MAASNPAFRIVDGELLPFNPVSDAPNVEEAFRVEILLVSARFKTQNSAAAASDSSPTATVSSAPDGAAAGANCFGGAVAAASKTEKLVDTSIYAFPELPNFPKCTFKGPVKDRVAAAAITVSSDPTAEDEVTWAVGACVATFENRRFKLVHPDDGPREWQQDTLEIRLFQAKATKGRPPNFLKDQTTKRDGAFTPLSRAVINLADFVSTSESAVECEREVTYTSHPPLATKYSLTLQVKTTPLNRQPAARLPKSPQDIANSANGHLGNARVGRELLFKVDSNCNFNVGTSIGIAVEDAWRGTSVMLLHTRSTFEECDANAPNFFGRVTSLELGSGYAEMRVKCPEVGMKNGKPCPESRFGWRLLSTCSSALKERLDTSSAPCSSFDLQNEPIFCLFPSSEAARADDLAKQNEEASAQQNHQNAQREITELKQRTLQDMNADVQLTLEELGAVLLRTGFLVSQPLVSACVRMLIIKWYPDTHEDECSRMFGSKEGPWDIFYVFDYLRKRDHRSSRKSSSSFSNLLHELGYVGDADLMHKDRQQRLLEDIMDRCFLHCCSSDAFETVSIY